MANVHGNTSTIISNNCNRTYIVSCKNNDEWDVDETTAVNGVPLIDAIFYNIPGWGGELRSRINALSEVQRRNCERALSKYHGDCGIDGMTAVHTSIYRPRSDVLHIRHLSGCSANDTRPIIRFIKIIESRTFGHIARVCSYGYSNVILLDRGMREDYPFYIKMCVKW